MTLKRLLRKIKVKITIRHLYLGPIMIFIGKAQFGDRFAKSIGGVSNGKMTKYERIKWRFYKKIKDKTNV